MEVKTEEHHETTIAPHSLNITQISVAQELDINSHKKKFEMNQDKFQDGNIRAYKNIRSYKITDTLRCLSWCSNHIQLTILSEQ